MLLNEELEWHVSKAPAQRWAMSTVNYILMAVSSALSMVGCLLIISSYALYTDIRTSSRHIILCITIADFVVALSNLSGLFIEPTMQTNTICIIQSFISTTAVLSSFLWTMMLAVFLYITIVRCNVSLAERLVHPWFHLFCWFLPLSINMVALFHSVLGNNSDASTSGWCWINLSRRGGLTRTEKIMWMLIDGKGIEIVTYIVVLVLYVRIKIFLSIKIRKMTRSGSFSSPIVTQVTARAARTTDRKLILVPILLILLRMWGTIRFFLFVIHPHTNKQINVFDKTLISLQAVGDNFQGAINCVLFCFLTPKVWNHIRYSAHKCLAKCFCLHQACLCCPDSYCKVEKMRTPSSLRSDEGSSLIDEYSYQRYYSTHDVQ